MALVADRIAYRANWGSVHSPGDLNLGGKHLCVSLHRRQCDRIITDITISASAYETVNAALQEGILIAQGSHTDRKIAAGYLVVFKGRIDSTQLLEEFASLTRELPESAEEILFEVDYNEGVHHIHFDAKSGILVPANHPVTILMYAPIILTLGTGTLGGGQLVACKGHYCLSVRGFDCPVE
jgi:hypothetical protein